MGATHAHSPKALVLDTSALIAVDRGDKRVLMLLRTAEVSGRKFLIPAGVVAQAWRNGRVQVYLARFLRSSNVEIVDLDARAARLCGEYCAIANTADIIDASVVILAKQKRVAIVSSDLNDLKRLDPTAQVIPI